MRKASLTRGLLGFQAVDGRQKLFAVLPITSVAVGNRILNQIFCNFHVDITEMVSV
ncbi:MAG: hypothetical protein M1318_04130 [Firmicutes bacterium]|nr:hypothetical protein [Bacillota bacterium]